MANYDQARAASLPVRGACLPVTSLTTRGREACRRSALPYGWRDDLRRLLLGSTHRRKLLVELADRERFGHRRWRGHGVLQYRRRRQEAFWGHRRWAWWWQNLGLRSRDRLVGRIRMMTRRFARALGGGPGARVPLHGLGLGLGL